MFDGVLLNEGICGCQHYFFLKERRGARKVTQPVKRLSWKCEDPCPVPQTGVRRQMWWRALPIQMCWYTLPSQFWAVLITRQLQARGKPSPRRTWWVASEQWPPRLTPSVHMHLHTRAHTHAHTETMVTLTSDSNVYTVEHEFKDIRWYAREEISIIM